MLEITAEELKQKLEREKDLLIIDVREDWEYDEVNLGVKNIPLGELPQHLKEFPDKDAEIIVHCQSGRRSGQAQKYLMQQGYSQVISLKGGIEAYLQLAGNGTR